MGTLLFILIFGPFFIMMFAIITDEDSYVFKDLKAKRKLKRENNQNNWKAKPPKRKIFNNQKKQINSKIIELKRKSS